MAIIDSQVHAYEANTPKRPWHSVPNWPDHATGGESQLGAGRHRERISAMYALDPRLGLGRQGLRPEQMAEEPGARHEIGLTVEGARTLLEIGTQRGDISLVDEATRVLEQAGARVDLAVGLHARARMASDSGADIEAALCGFDRAIAALVEVKAEYTLGVAYRQRARLHVRLGRHEQARADLSSALRCFTAVGAAMEQKEAEHDASALGLRRP
jgi:hypothetical protein